MKKFTAALRYLLSVHVLALLILSIFRICLFITNISQVGTTDNKSTLFIQAMLKGVQFDNVIACYIIVLPLVILSIVTLFNKISSTLLNVINIYFIILYFFVFALSAADIPYFSYYFNHIGASVMNWMGFGGTTANMILQESSYYVYFALFIILFSLFCIGIIIFKRQLFKTELKNIKKKEYRIYIPITLLIWIVCFLGVRGTFDRYPLRIGNAYFSSNSFFNQMGINPTFFLIKSYSSFSKKHNTLDGVIPEQEAILFAHNQLVKNREESSFNPIFRKVATQGDISSANVVIILMESMSSNYLDFEYKGKKLTPYLNELIDKSYYFPNFYSAGIHTNNGIAATLSGFPAQFDKTMMGVNIDIYNGLSTTLHNQGYQTLFFLTSNPQYDNMNCFLLENGFDRIYSQYDYPAEKVVNNFGVQDDYLFEYGIERLNEVAKSNKPFFGTFMTVSNHPPYIVPEKFKEEGKDAKDAIISFVDNSLKDFIENASKQEWYNNTIFIILGDHGKYFTEEEQPYDMSLSYNHIPLIIYSPLFKDMPQRFEQFGSQIDIFPTVMGLLNRPYINNSMGIDLFKTKRPYTYFVSDNHLGCIDDEFFYIYNPQTKSDGLYKYRNKDINNIANEYPAVADSMKTYAVSMMITADYLVKNKMTSLETERK